MLTNEDRADLGEDAVRDIAGRTGVAVVEDASTALTDVLSYVAHFCDRLGLDAADVFDAALRSYDGDSEDGPPARHTLMPDEPLEQAAPSTEGTSGGVAFAAGAHEHLVAALRAVVGLTVRIVPATGPAFIARVLDARQTDDPPYQVLTVQRLDNEGDQPVGSARDLDAFDGVRRVEVQ